jgi:predicted TIM-barrel fold metal-dependent hydrolase
MVLSPDQLIISGDSHFVEPPDLFTTRLPKAFRDRAPTTWYGELPDGRKGEFFIVDNMDPEAVAGVCGAGKPNIGIANLDGYKGAPKSVWDPAERLKEQDRDGVAAEVLYPSWGMFLFSVDDPALRQACFTTLNQWAGEYCTHAPNRLKGLGAVDLTDVDSAVAELERAAKLGLSGVMISGAPDRDRPYSLPEYDRFWAAATDLNMPLAVHILTGTKGKGAIHDRTPVPDHPNNPANLVHYVTGVVNELKITLGFMIGSGVFDRHPALKFVLAETDVGWIPHFIYRMGHFTEVFSRGGRLNLKRTAEEIFKTNIYATAQFEKGNLRWVAETIGADHFMWSSDYPHYDCPFPQSREYALDLFSDFPPDAARMMLEGTAAALYDIDVASLPRPRMLNKAA